MSVPEWRFYLRLKYRKKLVKGAKPGVAGWRLKPAVGVYGRLALDPIAALQGDKKARLQSGGGFPLL
jgi:hypothetical protein